MRNPLALLSCAALLVATAHAEPSRDAAAKKTPKKLREKVCAEGAYLGAVKGKEKRAAAAVAKAPSATPVPDAEKPAGSLWRVAPGGDDAARARCAEQFDTFYAASSGDFTIAPAVDEQGKAVTPQEAAARSVSLSSLGRLTTGNAAAIDRFFENKLNRADVTALSGFDVAAGRALAPGNMSFVNDGGVREAFTFTPQPRRTLGAADVPGPSSPATFQPGTGSWNVPRSAAPRERGWRESVADYTSQISDWANGSPIAREEGRSILPPPAPNYPGNDPSINARLPDAAGLDVNCLRRDKNPADRCWGTRRMVDLIVQAGADLDRYFSGKSRMRVNDLSKVNGGYISGHVSHQRGVDVDIMFNGPFDVRVHTMVLAGFARNSAPSGAGSLQYTLVDQSKHDALRWGLKKLVAEGVLDAAAAQRASASIRHWSGHNDHFHFRIH